MYNLRNGTTLICAGDTIADGIAVKVPGVVTAPIIDKYVDDYVENDIIVKDIVNIICERQETAHKEYLKLEDLELRIRE